MCKKCRSRVSSFLSIWVDKDFTGFKSEGQSDSKFGRTLSSGWEGDISGSSHARYQSCRPSSQSESSETSSVEMNPMDPAHIEGNSKDADANSVSASEVSHSQHGRSKADVEEVCNSGLTGVSPSADTSFLCQWVCNSGNLTFMTASTSQFVCQGEDTVDIPLLPGENELDCRKACAAGGCTEKCAEHCSYLASAAMDAGQAVCVANGEPTSTGYALPPLEKRGLSPGVVVLVILLFICNCCCVLCKRAVSGGDNSGGGGTGGGAIFGRST